MHKYNTDGTLASSWHAWWENGERQLPIQEDETGLPLWALWHHFDKFHDVEFIGPLFRSMIRPAATFMESYVDANGLPQPSYDLWEERRGVHAWTIAATWAGLDGGGALLRGLRRDGRCGASGGDGAPA